MHGCLRQPQANDQRMSHCVCLWHAIVQPMPRWCYIYRGSAKWTQRLHVFLTDACLPRNKEHHSSAQPSGICVVGRNLHLLVQAPAASANLQPALGTLHGQTTGAKHHLTQPCAQYCQNEPQKACHTTPVESWAIAAPQIQAPLPTCLRHPCNTPSPGSAPCAAADTALAGATT